MSKQTEGPAIRTRSTLSDQLYAQILEQIIVGKLQKGDKLPSERAFRAEYDVSRSVVRKALGKLRDDHIIESHPGVGYTLLKRPPRGLIQVATARSVSATLKAMEARMVVETTTARLAAQRGKPQDIANIEVALKQFEAQMARRDVTGSGDFEFHLSIARASGNEVFVTLLESIRGIVERGIYVALSMTREGSQARVDRVLQEHRQIYQAVLARDSEAAGLAMGYHMLQGRIRVTEYASDL